LPQSSEYFANITDFNKSWRRSVITV
jgi:hypothetical protein